jgi:aminoglycoside phosphotransferase (APT) family kinase protein
VSAQGAGLKKIAEGREAEIFAWGDGTVLRLLRDDANTARLEHEADAMRAAASCGVPVPAPGEILTYDGRAGMVMERVDGPDLLTLLARRPWTFGRVARMSGELHAALNAVPAPGTLPDLREACERHIRSLDVPTDLEHLRAFALQTLASVPDGDALCHGDFHPGNIIDSVRGPVVIDWPNAARGDPDADYARALLLLKLGEPPPGSSLLLRTGAHVLRRLLLSRYRAAYAARRRPDPRAVARWQVVRAADRLSEGIEIERPRVIALLRAQELRGV